jgi:type II secretory pathway predicted ATPase ExeA
MVENSMGTKEPTSFFTEIGVDDYLKAQSSYAECILRITDDRWPAKEIYDPLVYVSPASCANSVKEMIRWLLIGGKAHLVLGPVGGGKTFLIRVLEDQLPKEYPSLVANLNQANPRNGLLSIYLDAEDIGGPEDLWYELGKKLDLDEAALTGNRSKIMTSIGTELSKKNLLVVFWINEAQNVPSEDCWVEMRHLLDSKKFQQRISFVLAGPTNLLDKTIQSQCQSLFRRIETTTDVKILSPEEIDLLILKRMQWATNNWDLTLEDLPFKKEALTDISYSTGGIASFAVKLMGHCLTELQRQGGGKIDQEFVRKVYDEKLRGEMFTGEPLMDLPGYDKLGKISQKILKITFRNGTSTIDSLYEEIFGSQNLKGKKRNSARTNLSQTVERLFGKYLSAGGHKKGEESTTYFRVTQERVSEMVQSKS